MPQVNSKNEENSLVKLLFLGKLISVLTSPSCGGNMALLV